MSSIAPTIVPHLWCDKEAVGAAEFHVSVFPDWRITNVARLEHAPSGGETTRERVTDSFLTMGKIDTAALEHAADPASGDDDGASR